ncbi:hypothetical protein O0Q64_002981 [Acinetobacter baumannii]|nr:hypothetical protein [Acinetobacter baumannii]
MISLSPPTICNSALSIAVVDALSSHPATEERIRMVHDFEKKQHANY